MENPVRTESLPVLSAEYWETDGSVYGALVDNLNIDGLLMLSVRDMPIGTKLNVRIFYVNEYELGGIQGVTHIASKGLHIVEKWQGYKYGLKFVQISEEDLQKLKDLLNNHPKMEKLPENLDIILGQPLIENMNSPSPADSNSAMQSTVNCTSYEKGKCLKTHAFCDGCGTAEETILTERVRTTQNSRSHQASSFTSVLSQWARTLTRK